MRRFACGASSSLPAGLQGGARPANLELLRDIRRAQPELVDAETATWNFDNPRERFTYERVLMAK